MEGGSAESMCMCLRGRRYMMLSPPLDMLVLNIWGPFKQRCTMGSLIHGHGDEDKFWPEITTQMSYRW